jgi:hypothetical protein
MRVLDRLHLRGDDTGVAILGVMKRPMVFCLQYEDEMEWVVYLADFAMRCGLRCRLKVG